MLLKYLQLFLNSNYMFVEAGQKATFENKWYTCNTSDSAKISKQNNVLTMAVVPINEFILQTYLDSDIFQ